MQAKLVLEDGRVFNGEAIGNTGTTCGEVVFNTGMTGYEEILTDPSYRGQLVTLTYPLVGNYGINEKDFESYQSHLAGLIIKEACDRPSHWQSRKTLHSYLNKENICGISGIDTRALTRHIRKKGNLYGVISSQIKDERELLSLSINKRSEAKKLVKEVSVSQITRIAGNGPRIVVYDFGVKYNILRKLRKYNADLIVVPYNTSAREVISYKPDGIILSSGPGDPRDLPQIVKEIKKILYNYPVFGICLGHQLLGLSFGASIKKLKFGHHGVNHPVKNKLNGKINITTQNHGYCICTTNSGELETTHINLNDGTIEGIRHRTLPIFSLQFHPEAGPGPTDTEDIFKEFFDIINERSSRKTAISL